MERVDHTVISEGSPGAAGAEGKTAVSTTMIAPNAPNPTVTKAIVAVHGVGDQYKYATIQSVVNQFCGFYNEPAAIPLGNFHTGQDTYSLQPPYPSDPFERFAFAEVYWAGIPRELVDDRHNLEEAKKWSRTIIERLRLRWREKGRQGGLGEEDFRLIGQVLSEMIETIAVIDWLCHIADKAGVFTFDIRKLLEDYLGDVQVVTEFKAEREKILGAFDAILSGVHRAFPSAQIYIVAHSEGTVVSLLGLLKAFRDPRPPGWARNVRGLMTLGSPIDKHLVLWPELFDGGSPALRPKPEERIEWRNYYDYGDPIGFELNEARRWITEHGWNPVFNFTSDRGHDNGFARYPFPGKAHVDYWNDPSIFGHFIETVVRETPPKSDGRGSAGYSEPPSDLRLKQWLSYIVPYLGVAALLVVAAYVLFKAVAGAIDPKELMIRSNMDIVRGVAGLAGLLMGLTVVARIPRLTRSPFWRSIAVAIGLLAGLGYAWSVRGADPRVLFGIEVPPGGVTLAMSVVTIAIAYLFSTLRPSLGLKPLIFIGTIAVTIRVVDALLRAKAMGDIGPVWPVFLATIAFLYLWWLAALLFDLVFIWHHYIRHSKMNKAMRRMMRKDEG
jgi:hypothetical protein